MRMRDDVFVFWIRAEKWDALQDVIRETCYELELDEILEDVPPEAADERYTLLRPFGSGKVSTVGGTIPQSRTDQSVSRIAAEKRERMLSFRVTQVWHKVTSRRRDDAVLTMPSYDS